MLLMLLRASCVRVGNHQCVKDAVDLVEVGTACKNTTAPLTITILCASKTRDLGKICCNHGRDGIKDLQVTSQASTFEIMKIG